ncbi:unnamed protein product [Urochloa decumbens]|uniref:PWWP domain-containing protein n=1 Tax=Urochloa decumbens TaxID=240449 RepID=A0ABC8ZM28_9POAL
MEIESGGEREQPGGVTAADAEAGALVWVVRRNGSWWPGRILGMDELPEGCFIPPRPTCTPIKLLGRPDGSIDWYDLEKSKHVKPFRCGEFDECIENAKARAHVQNMSQNEGKYVHTEDAIMHALEIEKSRVPPKGPENLNTYRSCAPINCEVSKPINQTGECSKEDMISMRCHRRSKMKIISFITPISKGNHKGDENLLSLELDTRVEGAVCELTNLEKNVQVYDVQLTALGNYTGHGLHLASLTSKSTGNRIKGYPVAVDVLEDCSAASIDDHIPAIRSPECLLTSRVTFPRKERSPRSKSGGHKKTDEHNLDQSTQAHAKKPAPDVSPKKMQRLSYSASSRTEQRLTQQGRCLGLMSPNYGRHLHSEEGIEEEKRDEEHEIEEDEEEDPSLHFAAESSSGWTRESSKKNPVVEKGSLLTRSRPRASCKPVVAKTKGPLLPTCSPLCGANSTRMYHLRPTAIFSGPPLSLSPVPGSTESRSGCASLYSCSSSLCAPVRLV